MVVSPPVEPQIGGDGENSGVEEVVEVGVDGSPRPTPTPTCRSLNEPTLSHLNLEEGTDPTIRLYRYTYSLPWTDIQGKMHSKGLVHVLLFIIDN